MVHGVVHGIVHPIAHEIVLLKIPGAPNWIGQAGGREPIAH
ncbi:MAG: hypothetical protein ACJATW_002630 [Glaciecola sp.]|jgi:hypothetical protein